MSDDITGIFDHLDPADFDQPTSALQEVQRAGDRQVSIDEFVDSKLTAVRFAFSASAGKLNPMAFLANPSIERLFGPQPDETLGEMAKRLQREARIIDATQLFFCQITEVGTLIDERNDLAADSTEAMEIARAMSTVKPGVFWYAEDISGDHPIRHTGFLAISGAALGDAFTSETGQPVKILEFILHGDSSRPTT